MIIYKFILKTLKVFLNAHLYGTQRQDDVLKTIGKIDIYDLSYIFNTLRFFFFAPTMKLIFAVTSVKSKNYLIEYLTKYLENTLLYQSLSKYGAATIYHKAYRKKQRRPLRLFILFSKMNYIRNRSKKMTNHHKIFANSLILFMLLLIFFLISFSIKNAQKIYHSTYITDGYAIFDLTRGFKISRWNLLETISFSLDNIKWLAIEISKYTNTYNLIKELINFIKNINFNCKL